MSTKCLNFSHCLEEYQNIHSINVPSHAVLMQSLKFMSFIDPENHIDIKSATQPDIHLANDVYVEE